MNCTYTPFVYVLCVYASRAWRGAPAASASPPRATRRARDAMSIVNERASPALFCVCLYNYIHTIRVKVLNTITVRTASGSQQWWCAS